MPHKQKPILFLQDKIAEMLRETKSLPPKIFAASILLLLAATLMLTVVFGLRHGVPYQPYPAKQERTAALSSPENKNSIIQEQAGLTPQVPVAVPVPPSGTEKRPESDILPAGIPVTAVKPVQPLAGKLLVHFGWQEHALFKDWRFHNGIDIEAVEGQAAVAAVGGKVREVTTDGHLGLTVIIESGEYMFYYASLSSAAVQKGQTVSAGQRIGAAGQCPAEPYIHLHFAVKKQDRYIDAERFLKDQLR